MTTSDFEELLRTARQALADGWVDEAKYLYDKARLQRPDSPDAYYGLATTEFMLDDVEAAAIHFQQVTRLDPQRAGAYVNLGAALTRLGKYPEAAQAILHGIRIQPQRAEGYYNLGLVYRAAGDSKQALKAFEEATRIDPQMADAHFNLGNLLVEQGHLAAGVACFRKTLDLQPSWEKAARALAQGQAALHGPHKASTPESTNGEKRIDPTTDGPALVRLNDAISIAQTAGTEFLTALTDDVTPTVRELTMTLVGRQPGTTAYELAEIIERYSQAVNRFRVAYEDLQDRISEALAEGDRLPHG
jgi:tetratricopeptide (TPR) repeat protein